MWFKSYKHFYHLTTDGRKDSHSDYSAKDRAQTFPVQSFAQIAQALCSADENGHQSNRVKS